MRVLDITVDLGAGTSPAQLEALVRAVRVAADVGRDAEFRRIRSAVAEQLKNPTDAELREAIDAMRNDDQGTSASRVERLLEARRYLSAPRGYAPGEWYEHWLQGQPLPKEFLKRVTGTGYERVFAGVLSPWSANPSIGLDALDPELYLALVADRVERYAPTEIVVRRVRYENPFGEELAAIGTGAEALQKTAGIIETVATLGSRRKIMKADADVAERTVSNRIAASELEIDLMKEQLRQTKLANDIAEQELLAKRIDNAQALRALSEDGRQRVFVELFSSAGDLHTADAVAGLASSDAAALGEFVLRPPQLEQSVEPDPEEEA